MAASTRIGCWSGAGLHITLLALFTMAVAGDGIWTVDIDEGPAPPPRLRPPFSRNARYDPSLLKYQIPALVGAYVGFVVITMFCVVTFGRRLRKNAQAATTVAVEMVKPLKQTLDPSPVSPSSTTMLWQKWTGASRKGTPSLKSDESPIQPSVVAFDDKTLEKDKILRQEEMERLYAAVIAQDAKAPRTLTSTTTPPPPSDQFQVKTPTHARNFSSSSRNFSQPSPGLKPDYRLYSPPPVPATPPYAAYTRAPAMSNDGYAYMPTSPPVPGINSPSQRTVGIRGSPPPQSLPSGPRGGQTPIPTNSLTRQLSGSSQKSKSGRGNIRNLQISAPIPKPSFPEPQDEYNEMDTRTPLSPHYIPANPGRPPPTPSQNRPDTPFEEDSEDETGSPLFYDGVRDSLGSDNIIHAYGGEDLDPTPRQNPRPTPLTVPTLAISQASNSSGDLPLRQQNRTPVSAGATANTLPFRAIHPPQPVSPSMPPQSYQTVSPGPVKTTFLSPRRDRFLPGGMSPIGPGGVPTSAALLSAGLATPYSPYMPFSPMTPVTPHLPNRSERRAQAREIGRTVVTEDDRVKDDDELWGNGFS